MVSMLASRVAGLRLAAILFGVIAPFLFVTYMLDAVLQRELHVATSEIKGISYVKALMPVKFGFARGKRNIDAEAKLAEFDPAIIRDLGIEKHHSDFVAMLNGGKVNLDAINDLTKNLVTTVGATSLIDVDPELETYYFGIAATHTAMRLSTSYRDLELRIANLHVDASAAKTYGVILELGKIEAAIKDYADQMKAGEIYLQGADKANSSELALDKMSQATRRIIEGLEKARLNQITGAIVAPTVITLDSRSYYDGLIEAWSMAANLYDNKTTLRRDDLSRKKTLALALALLAGLAALSAAYWMFRSTLKKLDDVEVARKQEKMARQEAEDSAQSLQTINAEMAELNRDLADKMKRLKDAQDELLKRGRMEQLGQLTATVAHELRNPLGSVRTSAFLLERKLAGKDLGVDPQIARINHGILRCDGIITQLLDFSRSRAASMRFADFDAWLAGVLEDEVQKLPSAVDVACDLGLDGKPVMFDEARFRRAIINLISNASEAMVGTGDDPSKFTTPTPRITIATGQQDASFFVSVSDNGPGMDEETLVKIREPLFTTKSFGTGLGVPVIEQIAQQHGGKLEIESKKGNGACFKMIIPIKHALDIAAA